MPGADKDAGRLARVPGTNVAAAVGLWLIVWLLAGCQQVPSETTGTAPAAPAAAQTQEAPVPAPPSPSATNPATQQPTPATTAPAITPTEKPDTPSPVPRLPAASLFDLAWDDRQPFVAGLKPDAAGILDSLTGASVYHLVVTVAETLDSLKVEQEVRYTNQETVPLEAVYFRLFPNLADGATRISALRVNGAPVVPVYELSESALQVPLSRPLLPGDQVVISLAYDVTVPGVGGGNYGTFILDQNILALAHFYPMIPVYDDEGWNLEIAPSTGDVVYADTSFYLVRVRAPADLVLVGSGVPVERRVAAGQQTVLFAAGPMRDFYLAASPDFIVVSREVAGTAVRSYAPAAQASSAELVLEWAAAALEVFTRRYGPYPFVEMALVSTPTLALGVEYPGVMALALRLYGPPADQVWLEGTVAHEVAHQWFYGLVGNDQLDEPWLDESLTQYATLQYYGDRYGPAGADGFRRSLQGRWAAVGEDAIPVGLPVAAYSPAEYSAIVYGRGPLFFEALAERLGQPVMEAMLRDYVDRFAYGIVTTETFQSLAESHCDCDLDGLFRAWITPAP